MWIQCFLGRASIINRLAPVQLPSVPVKRHRGRRKAILNIRLYVRIHIWPAPTDKRRPSSCKALEQMHPLCTRHAFLSRWPSAAYVIVVVFNVAAAAPPAAAPPACPQCMASVAAAPGDRAVEDAHYSTSTTKVVYGAPDEPRDREHLFSIQRYINAEMLSIRLVSQPLYTDYVPRM